MPYSLDLAVASGVVTLALTPLARTLALRAGALDHPGPRRVHAVATPRFGGLGMAVAVLGVAWAARLLPGPAHELDVRPLLGLTVASLPMLALGVLDDLGSVGPWVKLSVQACAALALTVFGYGVPLLTNPFGAPLVTGLWSVPLTIVWVVVLTNAVNLIDGLDGLAAGVVGIACAALWLTGRGHGDFYVMFLTAILLGACGGFLVWNRPPARIFMGDTGSQFLGLTLSAISLLENRKGTAALTLLLPLVALGVPLADGTLAFVRRALRGQPVFRGDAGHIHHRLLDAGLSPHAALGVLWGLSAMFGAAAILLDRLSHTWTALVVSVLGESCSRCCIRRAAPRPPAPRTGSVVELGSETAGPIGRAGVAGVRRRIGTTRAASSSERLRRGSSSAAPAPNGRVACNRSTRRRPCTVTGTRSWSRGPSASLASTRPGTSCATSRTSTRTRAPSRERRNANPSPVASTNDRATSSPNTSSASASGPLGAPGPALARASSPSAIGPASLRSARAAAGSVFNAA